MIECLFASISSSFLCANAPQSIKTTPFSASQLMILMTASVNL